MPEIENVNVTVEEDNIGQDAAVKRDVIQFTIIENDVVESNVVILLRR
jgi:hypothetical protein